MCIVNEPILKQAQFANMFMQILGAQSKPFAVDAGRSEQTIGLVEEYWVVGWNRELNMAGMTWAIGLIQVAGGTSA